jgi:hypothetical protein
MAQTAMLWENAVDYLSGLKLINWSLSQHWRIKQKKDTEENLFIHPTGCKCTLTHTHTHTHTHTTYKYNTTEKKCAYADNKKMFHPH